MIEVGGTAPEVHALGEGLRPATVATPASAASRWRMLHAAWSDLPGTHTAGRRDSRQEGRAPCRGR